MPSSWPLGLVTQGRTDKKKWHQENNEIYIHHIAEQTNYQSSFFLIVFLSFLSLSTLLLTDKGKNILHSDIWVIASLNKGLEM